MLKNKSVQYIVVLSIVLPSFFSKISCVSYEQYVFYNHKHEFLAKIPKNIMYRLSKVLAKSVHFSDHSEFVINISPNTISSYPQLLPESWNLFLKYLKAHESQSKLVKSMDTVKQALQDIGESSVDIKLDLLYFSSRYQFKELEKYLIPFIAYIWKQFSQAMPYDDLDESRNLESFVEKIFYSTCVFRKILANQKHYYPYFYLFIQDIITHNCWIQDVAISSNNKFIVSASHDGAVKIYDTTACRQSKSIINHAHQVNSMAISRDNRWIISGSDDGNIKIYDRDNNYIKTVNVGSRVVNVVVSSDGKFIVFGLSDGSVKIYESVTQETKTIIIYNRKVSSIILSKNNRWVVLGFSDGKINIYDRDTSNLETIINHGCQVNSIALSNNNKFIAAGFNDGTVKLYNIKIGETITIAQHSKAVESVAISSNNKFIVSASLDGAVKMYDRALGKSTNINAHQYGVKKVVISNDSRFVVSGAYCGSTKLYDIKNQEAKDIITSGRVRGISSLAISNDSKRIVIGSIDGAVRLAGNISQLDDASFFKIIESTLE